MKTSKNITDKDTNVVPKNERFLGQNLGVRRSLRELPEFSKENSQDKNSSKISGRAFRGSVRCAISIPSLRSGTANAATTIPNAGKKSRNKANYTKLNQYLNNDFDENYALVSHYIQLQGTAEAENYKNILLKNGTDVSTLPTQKDFNKQNDVPFPCKDKTKFTFIDLFAGIGGFRLAMQDIGGKCVFSSEWDDAAKQTYFENYGEVPFGDITKPETKALIPKEFDVLCAGFPCQPFSNAGKKKGIEDTRGTLFYHIAEILETHKPKAILLENVRGLISNDKGKTFQTVLQTITKMGYKCNIPQKLIDNGPITKIKTAASQMVLSAKDFGVPQNRPRIYVVLWKENLSINEFMYPKPLDKKTCVGDILETDSERISKFTISDKLWKGHQERRKKNAQKGYGFGYCSFNEKSQYTSTLSRRYYKDGSEILIEQKGKNPRKITPREAARLQGYKDSFRPHKSNTEAYKQFGNSVAIPVVEAVSKQILEQILES